MLLVLGGPEVVSSACLHGSRTSLPSWTPMASMPVSGVMPLWRARPRYGTGSCDPVTGLTDGDGAEGGPDRAGRGLCRRAVRCLLASRPTRLRRMPGVPPRRGRNSSHQWICQDSGTKPHRASGCHGARGRGPLLPISMRPYAARFQRRFLYGSRANSYEELAATSTGKQPLSCEDAVAVPWDRWHGSSGRTRRPSSKGQTCTPSSEPSSGPSSPAVSRSPPRRSARGAVSRGRMAVR